MAESGDAKEAVVKRVNRNEYKLFKFNNVFHSGLVANNIKIPFVLG